MGGKGEGEGEGGKGKGEALEWVIIMKGEEGGGTKGEGE